MTSTTSMEDKPILGCHASATREGVRIECAAMTTSASKLQQGSHQIARFSELCTVDNCPYAVTFNFELEFNASCNLCCWDLFLPRHGFPMASTSWPTLRLAEEPDEFGLRAQKKLEGVVCGYKSNSCTGCPVCSWGRRYETLRSQPELITLTLAVSEL